MNKPEPTSFELEFLPSATIETLQRRAALIVDVRSFFESREFFHVTTPVISRDIVVDRYLEPLSIAAGDLLPDSKRDKMYLQTSPEFAMKRLMAAGADAIYQIGPAFRRGERGRLHNPEFTMLEWYRTGQTTAEATSLIGDLVEHVTGRGPTLVITYAEMFQQHLGIDPHRAPVAELRAKAVELGIEVGAPDPKADEDRDAWLNLLLTHAIEPDLGRPTPVIVYDWPASQSALAKIRDDDPPVADRFELYIDGVELANGYNELLDAAELERRNERNNRLRVDDGVEALPGESRMLAAMRHGLPQCCGVALGIDRLVMVALGLDSIDGAMAFPVERA